jgi:hypothetical protein
MTLICRPTAEILIYFRSSAPNPAGQSLRKDVNDFYVVYTKSIKLNSFVLHQQK